MLFLKRHALNAHWKCFCTQSAPNVEMVEEALIYDRLQYYSTTGGPYSIAV